MMKSITLKDFFVEVPRWCEGCGNYNILATVKKFLVDHQIAPEQVVNVSGIGCSGRMSNYLNTYGIHAIHGRPITMGLGLKLAGKGLKVFIHSGDGDALSIGGNHLVHGIHRNFDCVFLLYDNQTYALTKNQTSPTTPMGCKTVTHPKGVGAVPLNAVLLALGAGASFVATTADCLKDHLYSTIQAAYEHRGFSFVHVLQRCAHYDTNHFNHLFHENRSFLVHEDGIPVATDYAEKTQIIRHDPKDLENAFKLANESKNHLGLFYRDSNKPCFEDFLLEEGKKTQQKPRGSILDPYKINLMS